MYTYTSVYPHAVFLPTRQRGREDVLLPTRRLSTNTPHNMFQIDVFRMMFFYPTTSFYPHARRVECIYTYMYMYMPVYIYVRIR